MKALSLINKMKSICVVSLYCAALASYADVSVVQKDGKFVLENEFVRISVDPKVGGHIDEYLVKATGRQLINKDCFLLGDHFWQQLWPGEFLFTQYEAKITSQSKAEGTIEVSRVSAGYGNTNVQNDVRIIRRMTLASGSPTLNVSIELRNEGKVGRLAGYWSQNIVHASGNKDEKQYYYRPSVRGVTVGTYDSKTGKYTVDDHGDLGGFVRDAQSGWTALLGEESHNGLAFVMRYDELMFLYNCLSAVTTEWQYKSAAIPSGKSWKTDFVVYPISKLPRVDYASQAIVAAVEPVDINGSVSITLHLAASSVAISNANVQTSIILAKDKGRAPTVLAAQKVATVTSNPTKLTFSAPHSPNEPLVIRCMVTGTIGTTAVSETFETWYGAKYGKNVQVDQSPLYLLPCPERHVTFLKPDTIVKAHNAVPKILFCRGAYGHDYFPGNVYAPKKAKVFDSYFNTAGVFPATVSVFPASYEDLMAMDVITLLNVDAAALGDAGQEMIKDYVHYGGTLLYGGEFWGFARGNLGGTKLGDLLPVAIDTASIKKDTAHPHTYVVYLKDAQVNICKDGKPVSALSKNGVVVYINDNINVKNGAEVLLEAQGRPIVVGWKVGQGYVYCITGTALGEAPSGKVLFTKTPEWAMFLKQRLFGTK